MTVDSGSRLTRRRLLQWAGASAVVLWRGAAHALEPEVPVRLQVDLLNRVIPYDRNFRVRAAGQLVVTVVIDHGDADSRRTGGQWLAEMHDHGVLGGHAVRALPHTFTTPAELAAECHRNRTGIVYITPGLRASARSIADSLTGLNVLSVASMPDDVRAGIVLGFAVRSGRPRLLVNLARARKQQVDFRADLLRMAEVIQ